jgi:hypothetical protein
MNRRVVFGEPIPDGIVPAVVCAYSSRDGAPIGYGERHCGTCGRLVARAVDAPVDARTDRRALTHPHDAPGLAS